MLSKLFSTLRPRQPSTDASPGCNLSPVDDAQHGDAVGGSPVEIELNEIKEPEANEATDDPQPVAAPAPRKLRSYSLPALSFSLTWPLGREPQASQQDVDAAPETEAEPDMEQTDEEQHEAQSSDKVHKNDEMAAMEPEVNDVDEKRSASPVARKKLRSFSESINIHEELVLPRLIGGTASEVLSDTKFSRSLVPKIEACLPTHFRGYDWKLLYSLAQHGSSLHTLLRKVHGESPTLVIVETAGGDVFGGFAAVPWRMSTSYYGIGESFVFSAHPKFEQFSWKRSNSMFMLSNDQSIAMGGGGGFAWYLNSDLSQGTSAPSATFGNRCLTTDAHFDVVCVEVWGFATKK